MSKDKLDYYIFDNKKAQDLPNDKLNSSAIINDEYNLLKDKLAVAVNENNNESIKQINTAFKIFLM